jgi:hypothetical protein
MKLEQALNIIKQSLDAGIKMGICPNLETSGILSTAWSVLIDSLKKKDE